MSSSNCCFLTCIQISQEASQVVWYSHLLKNFPQFVVVDIVKGFGIVNKAEIDVFLQFSCFFNNATDVGNLISGSSAFSKYSLNIWMFLVHVLLKSGLENFEHYFASVLRWVQLCGSLSILWHAFLWDWNENGPFPIIWPLLSFPNLLAYWVQHFHSIIFRIWNSSAGISLPLLALFIAILPKAHLTSHSRMSDSSEWLYHHAYLGDWNLFCTVLLFTLATSS